MPRPWYHDGLAFECTRCGDCCTGAPGYVWVSDEEVGRLAEHLGLSTERFAQRFVRQVAARHSLIEQANGDCVFWDREVGCTVYDARPIQCRTWPFWPENLASPRAWERTGRKCPGIEHGGFFSVDEIEAAARRTRS